MRFVILSVVVLAGCSEAFARTKVACRTPCGLEFEELPDGWTCDNAKEVETAALEAFQATSDDRLKRCGHVRFYRVEIEHSASFRDLEADGGARVVYATTDCQTRRTVLGSRPYKESSLPHEMVHMLQDCEPLPPFDEKDYYHSNWERDGITSALKAVFQ